ncbi:MAG: bifunctional 4-hydroxy-2-oxoglutarate aldolase/2-dehydro-3-deoxy-phosphogluconate aldolase [Candidatus Hadarchaeum sp.]|uniref:bifunctional 4-hydroxy-2-oxoglutarate aldolase/2-dehydro-3-deoxy-phosphogluconate aldolase n=1 Tax=Candidatus Hadarchaeum sp. TaxID=2883567 RepID=UPI00316E677A
MQETIAHEEIKRTGVIGIIRVPTAEDLIKIAEALYAGGLTCIEVTMNTPGALKFLESARSRLPNIVLGAGTVLDGISAREALLAGAQFLVTPTVELDILEVAHRYGVPAVIGAMTPTEILAAWEAGATFVKVFPASVLGPRYLQEIHGPLPQIPLVPTGGITAENAAEFIRAGAVAVCAGSWLVDRKALIEGRYDALTERARKLMEVVKKAREA